MSVVEGRLAWRTREWVSRRPDIVRIGWLLTFSVTYYLAFRYGRPFAGAAASPFWFPDSVLLCALLKSRPRDWWIFVAIAAPIRLFLFLGAAQATPLWFPVVSWAIDAGYAVAAASALRRFLANPIRIETIRDFAIFTVIAVLLMPAAFGFLGAAARAALGNDYLVTWKQWFLGDAVAQIVVTPAILSWTDSFKKIKAFTLPRRLEMATGLCALIVTGYFASLLGPSATLLSQPLFFVPIVLQFWLTIRFAALGGTASVLIWGLLLARAAADGHGAFSGETPQAVAEALQNYLFPRTFVLLLVAFSLEQMALAQNRARESEERFRIMADSSPLLVWMSGPDKLCDFFNQGWLNFTGRSLEQELGNGWAQGVHPDDLQRCLETYESAFDARQPFQMEYRLRRYDGQYRWVLDHGVPRYAPSGEFTGYVGSCVDITERKRVDELSSTLAHLQRLSVMGELSAAITHEIKQPLNAISLNTSAAWNLLKSEKPPASELQEILSEIREDIARTSAVVDRTRALVRKQHLAISPIDIHETIADVVRLLAYDAANRSVRLQIDPDAQVPRVLGDKTQVQQVLLNLIANGMEAMKDKPKPLELSIATRLLDGHVVRVSVIDRGCGIDANSLPRLFEPFFTTKDKGLGLGLSVSQTIIEAHGGSIWAKSNPEGGLTIHFTLRAAERGAA